MSTSPTTSFPGWRSGDLLVLPDRWNTSARCAKCNTTASVMPHFVSLAYVPAGYLLTLLLGIVIGILIIAVVMKRGFATIGLCAEHARRRTRLSRTALLLLMFWLLPILALGAPPKSQLLLAALAVAISASVVAVILWQMSQPVTLRDAKNGYLWIRGFSNEYLASCPELPDQSANSTLHRTPTAPQVP